MTNELEDIRARLGAQQQAALDLMAEKDAEIVRLLVALQEAGKVIEGMKQ